MNTYRFITKARCGKTDVIVQTADTLTEALDKFHRHNELKHTPMNVTKVEYKAGDRWFTI